MSCPAGAWPTNEAVFKEKVVMGDNGTLYWSLTITSPYLMQATQESNMFFYVNIRRESMRKGERRVGADFIS